MQKEKLITKINNFIIKLNRPTLVAIVLVYAVLLILLFIFIFPKKSFFVVPNYSHQTSYNDINLEVRVNPTRSVDDEENLSTYYGITAALDAVEVNAETYRYDFVNFQMSSLLTNDKMYYYTEKTEGISPITHHFSLNSTTTIQIPKDYYVKIKYINQEEVEQELTYKESMLVLGRKNRYSKYNIIADEDKHSDKDRKTQVRLDFFGKRNGDNFELRSQIEVVDSTTPFHVDMQSWIVTESGEVFIATGVYGFNQRNYYIPVTPHLVDVKLKPEYVYSQLVYYEDGKEPQSIFYKEKLYDLPETKDDLSADPSPKANTGIDSKLVEYIIIFVVGLGIILFATIIVVNNKNKTANQKNIDKKMK